MNIRRKNKSTFVLYCFSWLLVTVVACTPDLQDDPIPFVPFPDIVLNINLPSYIALKSKGGYVAIDGGVRGLIVYCQDMGVYYAYERNCSYHPNDACATVNVDASQLFMIDSCCNSMFSFSDGLPTGGIAWRPLRRYRVSYDGFELRITDEIVSE